MPFDTSRRGFFGAMAGLLIAPKMVSAKTTRKTQIQIFEMPAAPQSNVAINQYALVVEDAPLHVPFSYGRISSVEKDRLRPGNYRVRFTPPAGMENVIPNVLLNVHDNARRFLALIRDLSFESFDVSIFEPTTHTGISCDFSAVIFWPDLKTCRV